MGWSWARVVPFLGACLAVPSLSPSLGSNGPSAPHGAPKKCPIFHCLSGGPISICHLCPGRPEGSPHPRRCLQCQPRLSGTLPFAPADVKFDAVSGDYYPIIYFNDYWNLQKDYYPINESLASLPLRVSFCPLSLWRWQLYAAQSTKSPWNFLGDELYEQSDEEQDSVKVRWTPGASQCPPGLREGKGK